MKSDTTDSLSATGAPKDAQGITMTSRNQVKTYSILIFLTPHKPYKPDTHSPLPLLPTGTLPCTPCS